MQSHNDDADRAEAAFTFSLWRQSEQFRAIEGSDRKAEQALGLAIGSAGLFSAIATLVAKDGDGWTLVAASAVGGIIAVAFASALFGFFRSYVRSEWRIGPGNDFIQKSAEHPNAAMRLWFSEEMAASFETNEAGLAAKARWSTWALVSAVVEAGLTLLGFAVLAIVAGTTR